MEIQIYDSMPKSLVKYAIVIIIKNISHSD